MEIPEDAALSRELVQVRRLKALSPKHPDIRIALVVSEDDDNVWQPGLPGSGFVAGPTEADDDDCCQDREVLHSRNACIKLQTRIRRCKGHSLAMPGAFDKLFQCHRPTLNVRPAAFVDGSFGRFR